MTIWWIDTSAGPILSGAPDALLAIGGSGPTDGQLILAGAFAARMVEQLSADELVDVAEIVLKALITRIPAGGHPRADELRRRIQHRQRLVPPDGPPA